MKISPWTIALLATIAGTTIACGGCKSTGMDWSQQMPWAETKPQKRVSPYSEPVHLVAIWSPAICNLPGQPPTRGFGGRFYFYDNKERPIPVDGSLMVYGFDDTAGNQQSTQAERRFAFTAEQITRHFSESELGASYSIWIPWDAMGNAKKEISLVSVFTTDKGNTISSQPSRNLLPGPDDPQPNMRIEEFDNKPMVFRTAREPAPFTPQTSQSPNYVGQQIAYQQELTPAGQGEMVAAEKLQTMSISLPGSLADRLARAAPQQRYAPHNAAGSTPAPPTMPSGTTVTYGSAPPSLASRADATGVTSPYSVSYENAPYGRRAGQSAMPPTTAPASAPPSAAGQAPAWGGHMTPPLYPQNPAATNSRTDWSARAFRPWSPPGPPQAHFGRQQSPAQSEPALPPNSDPLPTAPYLVAQPSSLPSAR